MSSTEDKIINIANEVMKNKETTLGSVSKETGCGNPLIRGVLAALMVSNSKRVTFTGKKIKVEEILQVKE